MWLRQLKVTFLAYINKEKFNYLEGQIDPLEYHSLFFRWASSFAVTTAYEKMPMYQFIGPISAIISPIIAGVLFLMSFVRNTKSYDIALMTESGTYVVLMIYQILITYSVLNGRNEYDKLRQSLQDDFNYIGTRGQKYRDKFFENQKLTSKGCLLVAAMMFSFAVFMTTLAVISVVVTIHRQDEEEDRPMPFPLWVPHYDVHATPVYEILFASAIVFTFCYTHAYIMMVMSHVLWIRQITCKADIITWNLEDLLVDVFPAKNNEERDYYAALIKHRMQEIVEMHQSMFRVMEDYASVYKKCLLFEQIIASPVICMTMYCFVEKYESGEIQLLLIQLSFGVAVMVFVPNFLCTHLLEKVQSINDSCWNIPFWNAGVVLRPYLVLMMQMSMRSLPIVAPGFAEISLKTYSNTITRAYSGFNMLRTADFGFTKSPEHE